MFSYDGFAHTSGLTGIFVWNIVSLVLAIGGGIALYFIFLKGNKKYNNFLDKVRDFFEFKTLLLEEILKITYLILTIFITLSAFGYIGVSFTAFIFSLIFGNLTLRIIYELSILLIKICKNTSDINSKLKK